MRAAVLGLASLAACSASSAYVDPPWPADRLALVVVLDTNGKPLDLTPRWLQPGEAFRMSLTRSAAVRIFARAYPAGTVTAAGLPLSSCGLSFSGAAPAALPAPESRWVSPLWLPEDAPPELQPAIDAEPFALYFTGECAEPPSCPGYSAVVLPAQPGLRLRAIAAVDESTAVFGGDAGETGPPLLGRISGQTVELFPPDPRLRGRLRELSYDHRGLVVGATTQDQLFTLEPGGQVRGVYTLSMVEDVRAGLDGTVLAIDDLGAAFQLAAGSTLALSPRPDAPPSIHELYPLFADEIYARDRSFIWRYDGQIWSQEHFISLLESVAALGGDRAVMAAVGDLELVRMRLGAAHTWSEPLQRPFDHGYKLHSVDGMGGGRFVVAGDFGALAVWDRSRWCIVDPPLMVTFGDVSSAGERVAYVVGDGEPAADGRTALVRLEIPPVE